MAGVGKSGCAGGLLDVLKGEGLVSGFDYSPDKEA